MTDKCIRCKGTAKLVSISAKCSDMYSQVSLKSGKEYDGYVPEWISPDGYGDYLQMTICRHCGTIQGNWPELNPESNQFAHGKVSA